MQTSTMAKKTETVTLSLSKRATTELKYNIKPILAELPRKITLKEVARSIGCSYATLTNHSNIKQGATQRMDADTLHNLSTYLTAKLCRTITMEDLINKTDLQKLKTV